MNSTKFRASTRFALAALTLAAAFTSAQDSRAVVRTMSEEEKIQDALSAGPASILEEATLLDWPSEPGGDFRVLREGSNGWACVASSAAATARTLQDPACDDEVWLEFKRARLEGREPAVDRVGVSYMLSGDAGASNTDPFATGPTDDNAWHVSGPHVMLLMPHPEDLEGVSTDPHNGGPYVMWAGTPYAHIMVPLGALE